MMETIQDCEESPKQQLTITKKEKMEVNARYRASAEEEDRYVLIERVILSVRRNKEKYYTVEEYVDDLEAEIERIAKLPW